LRDIDAKYGEVVSLGNVLDLIAASDRPR
jgi:hypothetical protein